MHSPNKHLVDEYAKRPPVDRLVVSLALNYLRRKILGRPTQCPRTTNIIINIIHNDYLIIIMFLSATTELTLGRRHFFASNEAKKQKILSKRKVFFSYAEVIN